MCRIDQLLRNLAVDPRHADIYARSQKERTVVKVQVILGIDCQTGRERDLSVGGGELKRAMSGRPAGSEQVLGGRVRLGKLDVQEPSLLRAKT